MTDLTIEQETQLIAYVCDDWSEEQCRSMAHSLVDLRAACRELGL